MPYGLVALATAMFSVQFFFKNMFRSQYGGGIRATLLFSVGSGTVGFIIMLIMNGLTFEITPFSLITLETTSLEPFLPAVMSSV